MSLYPTKSYPITKGPSEFEVLRASHKFLREDTSASTSTDADKTWEERLAEKYYENLYREFALCDLKHYKSGHFALRWRTEDEVLAGTGETTCGNTRCKYHHQQSVGVLNLSQKQKRKKSPPELVTVELPFAYIEHGEAKSALVKVVLCPRCTRKLMWKRTKEKERAMAKNVADGSGAVEHEDVRGRDDELSESESSNDEDDNEKVERKGKGKEVILKAEDEGQEQGTRSANRQDERERSAKRHYGEHTTERASRRRSSRSRSPRRHHSHNGHSHSSSRKHRRRDT